MEEKVMMGSKRSFLNHWLILRLNLNSGNERNCKETTTFVKECRKIIKCKVKEIFNLAYKQGKSKEPDKFKEMYKIKQVKLVKASEKYPKLEVVMNLSSFNNVEIW